MNPFDEYEKQLGILLAKLKNEPEEQDQVLIYAQRLRENIHMTQLYGDTETRRAERNEILSYLNRLSYKNLQVPFCKLDHFSSSANNIKAVEIQITWKNYLPDPIRHLEIFSDILLRNKPTKITSHAVSFILTNLCVGFFCAFYFISTHTKSPQSLFFVLLLWLSIAISIHSIYKLKISLIAKFLKTPGPVIPRYELFSNSLQISSVIYVIGGYLSLATENLTQIPHIAQRLEDYGALGVILINTPTITYVSIFFLAHLVYLVSNLWVYETHLHKSNISKRLRFALFVLLVLSIGIALAPSSSMHAISCTQPGVNCGG